MTSTEKEQTQWETETGLAHDVDAWIANAKFGVKDEYAQKVIETSGEGDAVTGLMFLCDLVDEAGQVIASQGWSVGSGWIPTDDGASISHPKRNNVVGSSMYGQLQNRTVKELKVDMQSRGMPTEAKCWNGLGFHWMQEEHETVGGDRKPGLMPTLFLSERKEGAAPAPAAKEAAVATKVAEAGESELVTKLAKMVTLFDSAADFQKAALQVPGVPADDTLMAEVLDEGPDGFWAKHRS